MASSADEKDLDVGFPPEEDYEHLLEDFGHLAPPHEGELLQGHVVTITAKEVIVDFGYKLEGVVPIEQLRQPDGTVSIKAGDTLDVMMDRGGTQRARHGRPWDSPRRPPRPWDHTEGGQPEHVLV